MSYRVSVITEVGNEEQLKALSQTLYNNEGLLINRDVKLFVVIKDALLSLKTIVAVNSFFDGRGNAALTFRCEDERIEGKAFDILADSNEVFDADVADYVCVIDGGTIVQAEGLEELIWGLDGSFDGVDSALEINNENPTRIIGDLYKPSGVLKKDSQLIERESSDGLYAVDVVDRGLLMFSSAGWADFDGRERFENYYGLGLRRLGYSCGINVNVKI